MKTKLLLLFTFFSFAITAQISQSERQALIDFYNATDGDNWTNNTNWDTDINSTSDVSTWFGVTVQNNTIIEIRLFENNLSGNISNLYNLTNLRRLELSNNSISDEIAVSNFPDNINYIGLRENNLFGNFPDLSQLSSLRIINLIDNKLTGEISQDLFPSNINSVWIAKNPFSGSLDFSQFNAITTVQIYDTNISFLKLSSNTVSGQNITQNGRLRVQNTPNLAFIEIPNVASFTNLGSDYFDLGLKIVAYDQADKTATPNTLEREALKKLYENKTYTYANTIKSGVNDTEWLNVEVLNGETRITEIHTTGSGINGPMPVEIGVFTELKHLHIPNSGINTIATELKNASKLEDLYLNNNSITAIPANFYDLVNLKILNISNNQIPSIASGLGSFTDLEQLYFSNTQIDLIPTTIGNLKKLEILEFANTKISLLPPQIGGLVELRRLVAAPNNIASIPSEFGQLTKLQFLDFANCELSNTPAAFANLTQLETLFLNDNELQVVSGLGGFTKLKFLRLHNNRLGEENANFNTDLPEDMSDLVLLEELTLQNNKLTKLPANIGNINKLTSLNLNSNRLTSLPTTIGSLSNLEELSITSNLLTGLPSTIGNLLKLKIASLSSNKLESLPEEIGNLSSLEDLDIQSQYTSGSPYVYHLTSLPSALNNLTTLKTLNASNNKIEGDLDFSNLTSLTSLSLGTNLITGIKLGGSPFYAYITSNPNLTCVEVPTAELSSWKSSNQLSVDNGVAISDNCTGYRVPQKEREALIAFYKSTGGGANTSDEGTTWVGTNWDINPSGLSNVGSWQGITTGLVNGQKHITSIHLEVYGVEGAIPSEIKDLTELVVLNLGDANYPTRSCSITSLPKEIGLLGKLESLHLYNNKLTELPDEIGDLPNLTYLNLSSNELTSLPAGIGNFAKLERLIIDSQCTGNCYEGDQTLMVLPNEIGNITNLKLLNLDSNGLTSLPSTIGSLTNLEELSITSNSLKGLPSTIGNLSKLKIASLSSNKLESLPEEIGNLSSLEDLDIQSQYTSGSPYVYHLTSLPSALNNLTTLKTLNASNNKIEGDLDFSNLTSLTSLSLGTNLITGIKLGGSPFYAYITSNPNLTCVEVPTAELSSWKSSNQLSVDNGVAISDNCTGYRVPQKEREALIAFYKSTGGGANTSDEGTTWVGTNWDINPSGLSNVGSWQGITTGLVNGQKHITSIHLEVYGVEGAIPSEIKDLTELVVLNLGDANYPTRSCSITSLPKEIGLLGKLESLHLYNNKLTELPDEIGDLPNLTYLNLSSNELTSLPAGIGNFAKLERLIIDSQCTGNCYEGDQTLMVLPNEIGNITNLKLLNLDSNGLTSLPSTIGSLTNLEELSITSNSLKGLPSTIGNLSKLKIASLSSNKLESLPEEIGNLSSLEDLDIQSQYTSGSPYVYHLTSLPSALNNLTTLKTLNASNNKIEGDLDFSNLTSLTSLSLGTNLITGIKLGGSPFYAYITSNPNLTCVEVPTAELSSWKSSNQLSVDNGVAISDNCTGYRVPQKEREALIAFYKSTGGGANTSDEGTTWVGTNWDINPSGLSNVGSWQGITTGLVNGQKHITSIHLEVYGVEGAIPSEIKDLTELVVLNLGDANYPTRSCSITSLPKEIGLLGKLESLHLYNNKLTELPDEIGDLPNLTYLNLSSNELTSLPVGIGNFAKLERLIIDSQCTGNCYEGDQTLMVLPNEIGNITNLKLLNLDSNGLTSLPSTIGSLTNLEELSVTSNSLKGLPSTIGNLLNLKELRLNNNLIKGDLNLENLKILTSLYLNYNGIKKLKLGVSPTIFGGNSVSNFSAKRNALGCIEVPTDELVAWQLSEANEKNNKIDNGVVYSNNCSAVTNNSIPDLERDALIAIYNNTKGMDWRNDLSASYNGVTWLNDTTQKRNVGAWYGVTTAIINGQKHVTKVELNSNQLDGTIPSVIKNLTQLKELEINSNAISEIPAEIGELGNLEQLTFTSQLKDSEYILKTIPTEINNLTSLKRLELGSNQLEGNLDFSNLVNLTSLIVSSNQITGLKIGVLPNVFDRSYDSENQFRNDFSFYNQYLNCIAVPQNTISDWEATTHATNYPSIVWGQDCSAYNNIPENEMQALVDMYNNLDGANWRNNTNWNGNLAKALINNPYNATKWQGVTTKIVDGGKHITNISLSSNQLKGELPTSIGNLTKLTNLQISSNEISGALPATFGNLTSLETLYLNSNKITSLPREMSNMLALKTVYLQNNEIEGNLPDFTNATNLTSLYVNSNKFQFGDFEDEFTNYQNLQTFSYSTQAKVGVEEAIDFGDGFDKTLEAVVSGTNNTYQWYKNWSPITDATNSTYEIKDATSSDAAFYYCVVSNTVITGLTIETERITLNYDATLNTEDVSFSDKIKLYPNPVNDLLQIKNSDNLKISTIMIFNVLGKKVKVIRNPENAIDVSDLSKGIYFLNINSENGKIVKRIVKK
ncbi:leucine-rich repeat domain-containing protein [Polaribacter haliotis]|uniref:leucine-rich repeat domain-containing protein n=1 Tax=Polaribacter haliotis TaxID=1888915 RepID=UPI0030FB6E64